MSAATAIVAMCTAWSRQMCTDAPTSPPGVCDITGRPPGERLARVDHQVRHPERERGQGREDEQEREAVRDRVDVAGRMAQVGLVLGDPLVLEQPVHDDVDHDAPDEELGRGVGRQQHRRQRTHRPPEEVADPDLVARSGTLPRVLSVGTLNVWGRWADWPERLEILRETWPHPGPDVLMLQEVICDGHGDQAEEIAAAVGYPEWFSIEGHRVEDAREGVAILSRRTLHDAREEELPVSEPARRVLLAEVDVDGAPVTVACGHTVASPESVRARAGPRAARPRPGPARPRRRPERDAGDGGPAAPRARAHRRARRRPAPTWPMCHLTFGAAWEAQLGRAPHFSLERRRLDYLLARGLHVEHAGIHDLRTDDGRHASDHALVTAELVRRAA